MLPEYQESSFDNQALNCSHCNWKGEGRDAVIIDFFGVTDSKEVHCPECDKKIGTLVRDKGDAPGESANDLSFQLG